MGATIKKLFFVVMILIMALPAFAVNLEWDANSEEDLAGYIIYWGDASGEYTNSLDVGNVAQYDAPIAYGQYIAVTAYDNGDPVLESDYSNEVRFGSVSSISGYLTISSGSLSLH